MALLGNVDNLAWLRHIAASSIRGATIALTIASAALTVAAHAQPNSAQAGPAERLCQSHIDASDASVGQRRPPALLRCTPPTYAEAAREEGHQGVVKVHATVGENGAVTDVVASPSSPSPDLDAAALASLKSWRFSPAIGQDGKPEPSTIWVTLYFWKDTFDNIKGKSCSEYVLDDNWFSRAYPGSRRDQRPVVYILTVTLGREIEAFLRTHDQVTAQKMTQRLQGAMPRAVEAAYLDCVHQPDANLWQTLLKELKLPELQ